MFILFVFVFNDDIVGDREVLGQWKRGGGHPTGAREYGENAHTPLRSLRDRERQAHLRRQQVPSLLH